MWRWLTNKDQVRFILFFWETEKQVKLIHFLFIDRVVVWKLSNTDPVAHQTGPLPNGWRGLFSPHCMVIFEEMSVSIDSNRTLYVKIHFPQVLRLFTPQSELMYLYFTFKKHLKTHVLVCGWGKCPLAHWVCQLKAWSSVEQLLRVMVPGDVSCQLQQILREVKPCHGHFLSPREPSSCSSCYCVTLSLLHCCYIVAMLRGSHGDAFHWLKTPQWRRAAAQMRGFICYSTASVLTEQTKFNCPGSENCCFLLILSHPFSMQYTFLFVCITAGGWGC